jgi:lysine 6-dehydrogenase
MKSKYLILGSGKMGKAVAYDLANQESTDEILLADINLKRATEVAKWIDSSKIMPVGLNIKNKDLLAKIMKDIDVAIGCISYKHNYYLTRMAINQGVHFCDLGGNNTVVQKQFALNNSAKEAMITIIPDCGLAPGVVSIIVAAGIEQLNEVDEIHLRVGGLPQNPQPPLNYAILFSVEGLLNEYIEEATVIRDGKIKRIPSLTEIETITFPEPFGSLEAFQTSGGTSTLPTTLEGKVKELDYKTIRYQGHCEKMQAMLDLGFRDNKQITINNCSVSPRKVLEQMLLSHLPTKDVKDVTLARVEIIGRTESNKIKKISYQIIDYFDPKTQLTSMMRMTAYPISIIAQLLANETITKRGVITQEFNVPSQIMIKELQDRGINIKETKQIV